MRALLPLVAMKERNSIFLSFLLSDHLLNKDPPITPEGGAEKHEAPILHTCSLTILSSFSRRLAMTRHDSALDAQEVVASSPAMPPSEPSRAFVDAYSRWVYRFRWGILVVCPVPDRIHRKIRELRTQKGAGQDGCETQTVFGGVQAQGRAGEPSARYHPGGSLPEIWHLQFHAASLAASVSGPGGHHLSGSTRSQTQSPGAGVCTR